MRKVEVKNHNGYPAIFVNDEVITPMMISIRTGDCSEIDEEYYKSLRSCGVKCFFVPCFLEWCRTGAFQIIKNILDKLYSIIPDAYVFMRLALFPSAEWAAQNPQECYTLNTGEIPPADVYTSNYHIQMPHLYSFASQKWRQDAGNHLIDFCSEIDKLPYADKIIGYHVCAGNTSEWYYALRYDMPEKYSDFSSAFKKYFSLYLKEKYGTNEALKKAWRNNDADIKNPHIPNSKERYFAKNMDREIFADASIQDTDYRKYLNGTNVGHFLDVDKYQNVMDYFDAFDNATADSIIYFCSLIKEKYKSNMLTGAFFGYYAWTDFFDCGNTNGVVKILNDPNVDFLAAPGVYRNRQPGGFTGQRQMPDSYRLHNKIFFVEEDTRTHLEQQYFRRLFDYYNIDDTLNILKRDFGRIIGDDLQAWWFDQHLNGGRYKHEKIYELFAKQQEIAKAAYNLERSKGNVIAFIYDEESVKVAPDLTTYAIVAYFRDYEIAKIGAGVDQYYHNDMSNPSMPDYKLYVFFNTFYLSDKERSEIIKKLKKNSAVALWVYAPGLINPDSAKRLSVENISELIGIKMKIKQGIFNSKYRFNKNGTAKALDKYRIFGYEDSHYKNNIRLYNDQPLSFNFPLFYSDDSDATVWATYCENDLPAVVSKQCDGFTSIYHGSKIMSHEFVREIANMAGCHIFSTNSDCIYVNNNFLTIHATSTGVKTLYFKKPINLYEVYENKFYGLNVKEIQLEMHVGQTYMFSLNGKIT